MRVDKTAGSAIWSSLRRGGPWLAVAVAATLALVAPADAAAVARAHVGQALGENIGTRTPGEQIEAYLREQAFDYLKKKLAEKVGEKLDEIAIDLLLLPCKQISTARVAEACDGLGRVWFDAMSQVGVTFTAIEVDPADANYRRVASPPRIRFSAIRPGGVISANQAAVINALAATRARETALTIALIHAHERALGASRAGKASAERRQTRAARRFALALAANLQHQVSLLPKVSRAIGQLSFLRRLRVSVKRFQNWTTTISQHGLPRRIARAIKRLPLDKAHRDTIATAEVRRLSFARPTTLRYGPDILLADHASRSATRTRANLYRKLAADLAKAAKKAR
jgi:hypothetical protein